MRDESVKIYRIVCSCGGRFDGDIKIHLMMYLSKKENEKTQLSLRLCGEQCALVLTYGTCFESIAGIPEKTYGSPLSCTKRGRPVSCPHQEDPQCEIRLCHQNSWRDIFRNCIFLVSK